MSANGYKKKLETDRPAALQAKIARIKELHALAEKHLTQTILDGGGAEAERRAAKHAKDLEEKLRDAREELWATSGE